MPKNPQPLHLDITLAHAKGAYTVNINLGSTGQSANVLLDTGSSSLAVRASVYRPDGDVSLVPTSLAQQVQYGQGAWTGPVLRTAVTFGSGRHVRRIADGLVALIETGGENFRGADGILGLAFRELDHAHDLDGLLQARGVAPALTWPWTFQLDDEAELQAFSALLRDQPRQTLTPLFCALEQEGVVADRFALLVQRALVHVLDDTHSDEHLRNDPLNRGVLVLGGGEECQSLYEGGFADIRILHERYYNANLIAVRVGERARIPAPRLEPRHEASYASNAIIDSGCSFILLEASIYAAVMADLGACDARFPELIERFGTAMAQQQGLPNRLIDTRDWPDLHFIFEDPDGGEVSVRCNAAHYWQRNAVRAGQSWCLLLSQLADWPRQSILGLPFMSGHYVVFDRRGTGVVRVARATPG